MSSQSASASARKVAASDTLSQVYQQPDRKREVVQAGDASAFEPLLIRLRRPLRAYLRGMVGQVLVDDVMQEVALRIFRQIGFLHEPRAFRAWVQRTATCVAFAHLQRDKRWREFHTDPGIIGAERTVAKVVAVGYLLFA